MCRARLFSQGSISLQSNFTWIGSSPISHSWHQKTRDTGLPDGENRILLRSLVLTQYRSVTDRQTDGYAVAYTAACKASFAARCKKTRCSVHGRGCAALSMPFDASSAASEWTMTYQQYSMIDLTDTGVCVWGV